MTQYNSLNVKLSNSKLNKLKPAIKNEAEVVLRFSSTMIGESDDETNFPHTLLIKDRQVSHLRFIFRYQVIKNSAIKSDTIRRISSKITRSITKNEITPNKKCNNTII